MGRVLRSAGWLIGDRVFRMAGSLVVGVWVARYLGPGRFGALNFASTLVALVAVAAPLGLDRIVVRELVRHPAAGRRIISTALSMRLIASAATAVLVVGVACFLRPTVDGTRTLVLILSVSPIFSAFDTFDLYFQAITASKYPVLVRNAAFLIASAARVVLVQTGAPLVAFAVVSTAEVALGAGLLWLVYRVASRPSAPRATGPAAADGPAAPPAPAPRSLAGRLLAESWPQILSSMAVLVYLRIDTVMLREMVGEAAVGVYGAASRVSEIWYFIPVTISAAVFPTLVHLRTANPPLYRRRLLQLFSVMSGIGITLSIPIALLSEWIVRLLYGEAYAEAAPILAVHIWASVFAFLGTAQESWTLAEGLLRLLMVRTIVGALLNVLLNLLLIPKWGGLGAAWATVVAYSYGAVLGNAFDARTRPIFWLQLRSLAFPLYLRRPRSPGS